MFKLRRYAALYLVFMLGLLLGHLNSDLLAIVGIPILFILIMQWDEVSFQRGRVKKEIP
ncbi:hypothetical protein P7H42_03710 [Vagococcus lutrae]|uniref:hypothetical protein n=1 Tax=Vagococcus lutrae TaxID=81947 RepID=UPI002096B9DE|nr:hypothetical protein [Vagococcus lutrae]MCO7150475.1 hypothetical protein [Vagococcus lutrae]MDT2818876.1 hypothetical protein [Vagococcus lutrae]MDT2843557.1 hypothetical protein [Vagococcus lutrae]WCG04444.1 hypothetical protein PML89_05525 [Vagococcus lutrae]